MVRKLHLQIFILIMLSGLISSGFAAASDVLPKISCVLTDKVEGDAAVGEKSSFAKDTPMLYLMCHSEEVEKGQTIKAVWIAVDTKNAAPANYKIDEAGYKVEQDLGNSKVWNGKYSLSKPNNGWPLGSYKVDLYVNDQLSQSTKFAVK